jgi:hypothetical protein
MNVEIGWDSVVEHGVGKDSPAMLVAYRPGPFKNTWLSLDGVT